MYYSQLNGFRCLFVFLVLIEHWFPVWVYRVIEAGSIGVNLFFVLSGFLIGEVLLKEKVATTNKRQSIFNFYAKRTLRIFPVYYLVILLYGLFFSTGHILGWNLLYGTNILECLDPSKIPKEFSHLWSLCVEEQFYLIFPFLIFFLPQRWILRMLIIGSIAAVFFRFGVVVLGIQNNKNFAYRLLPACFDCLLGGMILAYLKLYRKEKLFQFFSNGKRTAAGVALCLFTLVWLKTTNNELVQFPLFRLTSMALGFLLIGYSVTTGYTGFFASFLQNKRIAYLGTISYGIYLFHPFVANIYHRYVSEEAVLRLVRRVPKLEYNIYLVDFTVLTLLTVAISALSYELYEKKFLRLKRAFNNEKSTGIKPAFAGYFSSSKPTVTVKTSHDNLRENKI